MICIVGGSNIDIQGFSQTKLNLYDSNPGTIQKGFGGVGRNIAENLALLDTKPKLISPIGDDNFSNELVQYMKNVGCDMSDSMKIENTQLSTYLSVLNEENEMVVAIAAMDILEKFDKDFISTKKDLISKSDISKYYYFNIIIILDVKFWFKIVVEVEIVFKTNLNDI